MTKRFRQLHEDAPPVPRGLRPRPGVEYGCGSADCRDCYERESRSGVADASGERCARMIAWLKRRYRSWLEDRFVKLSYGALVKCAEDRAGRELSQEERVSLAKRFAEWLTPVDRFLAYIDRPTRTIHLFLSEVL